MRCLAFVPSKFKIVAETEKSDAQSVACSFDAIMSANEHRISDCETRFNHFETITDQKKVSSFAEVSQNPYLTNTFQ